MIPQRAFLSGMAAPLPALLAGLCLATAVCAPAAAMSAQGTLGDLLSSATRDDRRAPPPTIARYVSDEGESFVLDRSAPQPLLRFQESQEVIVLQPSPAARGDVLYKDEFGQPVLRQTKLGGVTLFAHGRPGGAPVAVAGQAQTLRLQAMSAAALVQRLGLASVRASRAAGRLVVFDADEVTPGTEAVFADAAIVAAEAVAGMTRRRGGRAVVSGLSRILFLPGPRSTARFEHGVMVITVVPSQGVAGRPSSARILAAWNGR